jgi:hypothetical protein
MARILAALAAMLRTLDEEDKVFAYGAIAVVVSLLVAGLFEYNFGDSEVRMTFLVLLTLPFCLRKRILSAASPNLDKQSSALHFAEVV